jgi:hypothetical protein
MTCVVEVELFRMSKHSQNTLSSRRVCDVEMLSHLARRSFVWMLGEWSALLCKISYATEYLVTDNGCYFFFV